MKNTELPKEGDTHDLVVVAFDMCSSSKLIEDLPRTGSLAAYDRFLKSLYYWLSFHST
jgi:hypothetical protein